MVTYVVAVVGGAAGTAGAVTSYQGSDYSYDTYTSMVTCDEESDGRSVHADYYTFNAHGYKVIDSNGAHNSCGTQSNVNIRRHRTCENAPLTPDPCSGWVYTGIG